jgi:hypothetical protein
MIRRVVTAFFAASMLFLLAGTGVANAQEVFVLESNDIGKKVWDEGWEDVVILYEYHGNTNQWWAKEGYTLVNQRSGQCATAMDDDTIETMECDGAQDQDWYEYDLYDDVILLQNRDTGKCATHNGVVRPLVQRPCEDRADQTWRKRHDM